MRISLCHRKHLFWEHIFNLRFFLGILFTVLNCLILNVIWSSNIFFGKVIFSYILIRSCNVYDGNKCMQNAFVLKLWLLNGGIISGRQCVLQMACICKSNGMKAPHINKINTTSDGEAQKHIKAKANRTIKLKQSSHWRTRKTLMWNGKMQFSVSFAVCVFRHAIASVGDIPVICRNSSESSTILISFKSIRLHPVQSLHGAKGRYKGQRCYFLRFQCAHARHPSISELASTYQTLMSYCIRPQNWLKSITSFPFFLWTQCFFVRFLIHLCGVRDAIRWRPNRKNQGVF